MTRPVEYPDPPCEYHDEVGARQQEDQVEEIWPVRQPVLALGAAAGGRRDGGWRTWARTHRLHGVGRNTQHTVRWHAPRAAAASRLHGARHSSEAWNGAEHSPQIQFMPGGMETALMPAASQPARPRHPPRNSSERKREDARPPTCLPPTQSCPRMWRSSRRCRPPRAG